MIVLRLRRTAAAASFRLECTSTTSALSMATSAPAPIAIPISARVRAGASLMPSPTIATFPSFCSERTADAFPSGSTPAMTRETPASEAMAPAVFSLSPVIMAISIPIFLRDATASAESRFSTSATAITPRRCPSSSKKSGVLPAFCSSETFTAPAFVI